MSLRKAIAVCSFALLLVGIVQAGPVRIVLSAGASYYSSKVKFEEHGLDSEPNRAGQPNWKWDVLDTFESERKGTIGFQAGIGAEVKLFGPASLCLDVFYRFAAFEDIQGTFKWQDRETWTGGSTSEDFTTEQAKMWYGTSTISGNVWHYLDCSKTKPPYSDEERLFKVSLGGPVFRLGVKIDL